jgi:flavorubredoxin
MLAVDRERLAELVEGSLYLLGGSVEIADDLSWRAPRHNGRFERFNAYLVVEDEDAVLIETGVAANWELVRSQLSSLLSQGLNLRAIVSTRLEPDCLSNLSRIASTFDLENVVVYAPGGLNPLDFFDDLNTKELVERLGFQTRILRPGVTIELSLTRVLEVIVPELRTLSTAWIRDRATSTLFSSDIFTQYSGQDPSEKLATDVTGPNLDENNFTEHFLTKFDWLPRADVHTMIPEVQTVYGGGEVERIAPTRGLVIEGRDLVRKNVEDMLSLLETISAGQRSIAQGPR